MKKQLLNTGIVILLLLLMLFQIQAVTAETGKTPPFTLEIHSGNHNLFYGLNPVGTNSTLRQEIACHVFVSGSCFEFRKSNLVGAIIPYKKTHLSVHYNSQAWILIDKDINYPSRG